MRDSKKIRFLIIAALLQIVWGLVPSASKFVIEEIPIELYIAIRWTISGTIFSIFVMFSKSWRKISLRGFSQVSILGILGYAGASFGSLYGLKLGGVETFALTASFSPVITSINSILFLHERPRKLFFLALPINIIGLILLVIGKYNISSLSIAGLSTVFIFSGITLESFVFIFSKKLKSEMTTTQYLAIAQIAAASVMWALQLTRFHQIDQISQLTPKGWFSAIFVSVVACVACYTILYWLLNYIDGHKLSLFDGLHTISAVAFGYLFFAETPTPMMLAGGALIFFGLVLGNLPGKDAAK